MLSRIFTGFLIFFTLVAFYSLHSVSSRDPTSAFFNPRVGYKPIYSSIRKDEAESFIVNHTATPQAPNTNTPKKLCVGIPSIARKGARYLRAAVGSLLEGLTLEERNEIYFIIFIAHSDPTIHPAYSEQWLPELTDKVLVYDLPEDKMNHIREMEKEGGLFREKGLFDYSYLVNECYKQNTPYMAMFEDDIVAMDGWYHRTVAAVEQVESLSALRKASANFLYLRLFYTEEFLGWNSEEWLTYVFYSALAAAVPTAALLFLRQYSALLKHVPSTRLILISSGISISFIAIFFALGRATVLPLPAGVNEMPKYGCCSQGFLFPREKAMTLVKWFEERKFGFVDVLTEEYADRNGELRWAITPSVIQHVGAKSSKLDDYGPESKHGMAVAEKIWNFGFEQFKSEDLKKEHWRIAQQGSLT